MYRFHAHVEIHKANSPVQTLQSWLNLGCLFFSVIRDMNGQEKNCAHQTVPLHFERTAFRGLCQLQRWFDHLLKNF